MIKLFWNTQNQIPPKTKSEDDENLINYNWGIYHKKYSDKWVFEISCEGDFILLGSNDFDEIMENIHSVEFADVHLQK